MVISIQQLAVLVLLISSYHLIISQKQAHLLVIRILRRKGRQPRDGLRLLLDALLDLGEEGRICSNSQVSKIVQAERVRSESQTFGPRGGMDLRQKALGVRDGLVEVVEDLVQLLADVGVLVDFGLELVEKCRIDQWRRGHFGGI